MQPLEFSEIHDVFRHGRELVLIIKQLGAPLAHKTLVRYVVDAQPLTAARAACEALRAVGGSGHVIRNRILVYEMGEENERVDEFGCV